MYQERPSRVAGAVLWRGGAPEADTGTGTGGVRRVLPDGCMDLIWIGGGLLVAGPDTAAHTVTDAPGDAYTGLRFDPGLGPSVIGTPAAELRDLRVPLAELWPTEQVRILTERLAEAPAPGRVLESIAADLPRHSGLADPIAPAVLAHLRPPPGGTAPGSGRAGPRVRAAADAVGLSERQLHRRCLTAFGYGPKTLDRILRMNRALDMARAGTPLALAAAAAGYADQAHLTREVRSLTGVPPGSLVGQRAGSGGSPRPGAPEPVPSAPRSRRGPIRSQRLP
ncbi:AraC-like DNA-binding protein [Spinactinospora alkalitolerans]|uniref:AraC-like DNA-binding protein n=1 Tax=Spinactinospora alkalitolerans TaxID=687207 RepID=A0A852U639_9ACTN|nr:helix-turn-helix domain-containing protein [Spinactinospora alkalitolerans]NYE50333.1 AraC-like DNA-binding protein [Spinactinospora alkalitolerans]